MKMRAEKFIELIEQGRYDKISKNGMDLIAERFRELQSEKLTLTDVGCSLPSKIEVNFDGNLLAEIETTDKKLKFLRAVNGYGEAVNVAKIQVVKK